MAETTEQKSKRGKAAPIVTGKLKIGVSENQRGATRKTRLNTDELSLAVRNAEVEKWYDIVTESPDRNRGVQSLLRRAAHHWGVGLSIDYGLDPDVPLVRFKVSAEPRQVNRKPKEVDASVVVNTADEGTTPAE